MALVDEGSVGTIIVKDMSRLGRDYLKVGMYTEVVFPGSDIRFIAINNGVDSANQQDSDLTPFLNIINEWYAKDTSKKIRAVFKAKGQNPESRSARIRHMAMSKTRRIKTTGSLMRKPPRWCGGIHLCVCGYGPTQIAKEMMKRGYMNPTAHAKAKGIGNPDNRTVGDDYTWQDSTVSHMLIPAGVFGAYGQFQDLPQVLQEQKAAQKRSVTNGRFSRIPTRRSSTKRPLTLCSASVTADAGLRRWARCRSSPEWYSAQTAEPSSIKCEGAAPQKGIHGLLHLPQGQRRLQFPPDTQRGGRGTAA
jgi:hypothetical protein